VRAAVVGREKELARLTHEGHRPPAWPDTQ
jgi:hypothetical protein